MAGRRRPAANGSFTADQHNSDDGRDAGPESKRRKVRKGTRSCWTCKRRKVRCTFSGTTSSLTASGEAQDSTVTCDECRLRGIPCVSQDLPETTVLPTPSSLSRQMNNKLGRMEALVEILVQNAINGTAVPAAALQEASAAVLGARGEEATAETAVHDPSDDLSTLKSGMADQPGPGDEDQPTYTTWFGHERGIEEEDTASTYQRSALFPATPSSTVGSSVSRRGKTPSSIATMPTKRDLYLQQYSALAAAWPSRADLEIILDTLAAPSRAGLYRVLMCPPYSPVLAAETPPLESGDARAILVLPPLGAHLVLVEQRLLSLATFLQHLHPAVDRGLARLSVPHRELMQGAVGAASTVVTSHDGLVGSLEGILCLVMESVYQSNVGNLRRAWLTTRRAIAVAQLLGLQREPGLGSGSLAAAKAVSPATCRQVCSECLWFRLVYANRFLSLMLGLPQGVSGESTVACTKMRSEATRTAADAGLPAAVVEARQQLRSFEVAHATIVGRIIERNEAWREGEEEKHVTGTEDSVTLTRSIDRALQQASRSMPARWWLAPTLEECRGDGAALFMQTHRAVNQLFHYYLVMQLHLPYMLRRADDGGNDDHHQNDYDYSRITCVSASREILSRFLSLRSIQMATFFCRSIDFFALIASMTLCLAHLDSHRRADGHPSEGQTGRQTPDFLSHQRLSDRGMMERVLESMEALSQANRDDGLSEKSAAFLRRMLAIEEDASATVDGAADTTRSEPSAAQDVRIWVPLLGTIRITRRGIFRGAGGEKQKASGQPERPAPSLDTESAATQNATLELPPWESASASAAPLDLFPLDDTSYSLPTELTFPDDVADWTLQGVDLAFFENLLIHGSLDDITGTLMGGLP